MGARWLCCSRSSAAALCQQRLLCRRGWVLGGGSIAAGAAPPARSTASACSWLLPSPRPQQRALGVCWRRGHALHCGVSIWGIFGKSVQPRYSKKVTLYCSAWKSGEEKQRVSAKQKCCAAKQVFISLFPIPRDLLQENNFCLVRSRYKN